MFCSLVDAPPKVVLGLAPPREDGHSGLGQRRSHLVLRREDVAGRPSEIVQFMNINDEDGKYNVSCSGELFSNHPFPQMH